MEDMDPHSTTADEPRSLPQFPFQHDPESARQDLAAWDAEHRREKAAERLMHSRVYVVARVLVGLVFVAAAAYKFEKFGTVTSAISARGFGDAQILLLIAIATEFCGGVLLAGGYLVRFAAAGLIGYLLAVTLMMNSDFSKDVNWALAFGNVGFIAALMMLAAHGSGGMSVMRRGLRASTEVPKG